MSKSNGTAAPAQINPTAVYAELRSRLQNADYFGRITLAGRLLNHRPWVTSPDGGDDLATAVDRLEADCFPDVCGPWYGLATLLELVNHFPDPAEWVRRKNNVKAMVADMQAAKAGKNGKAERQKPKPRTRDANAKVDRFLAASPAGMATMFQQELVRVEKTESELDRLKAENEALRRENAELRKENQRLKSYVNRIQNIAV